MNDAWPTHIVAAGGFVFDGRVKYGAYLTKPEFKLISERYV